jgi:hypothetical protein
MAYAVVTCKGCKVLVPFGKERYRDKKHYCPTCYKKLEDAEREKNLEDAMKVKSTAELRGGVKEKEDA